VGVGGPRQVLLLLSRRPIANEPGFSGVTRFVSQKIEFAGGSVAVHFLVPHFLVAF
jgi:hypothetical protein